MTTIRFSTLALISALWTTSHAQPAYRGVSTACGGAVAGTTGVTCDPTTITGLADNDLMIMFLGVDDNVGSADTITGWTTVSECDQNEAPGVDRSIHIWYRVAASESGGTTFTTTNSAADDYKGFIVAYSGVDTSTPLDATSTYDGVENDATPDHPDITTATNNAMVVLFQYLIQGTISTPGAPSTYNLQAQNQSGDDPPGAGIVGDIYHADDLIATAGAQAIGVWTHDDDATSDTSMCTMALKPSSGSNNSLRRRRN